jgi:hypothetical protein
MNGLKVYLEQILGENPNKMDVARRCDLPYHVIVDIFRGKVQRPDPNILEKLSAGLDAPYDDLALAAYGRLIRRSDPLAASPA